MNNKIINFGCRLNIYEGEIIRENLQKLNIDNIVVINTCAVTQEAERQAKQAIRKIRREDSSIRIIVTGCAAQVNSAVFAQMPEVDLVLGNEEKLHYQNYCFDKGNKILVQDIMSVKKIVPHLLNKFDKTRAFIQIQNGCNNRCSFCIIPYARGNSRSIPLENIFTQIKHLVLNGYKEIILTGVNITSYGNDLPEKPTLGQLIKRLLNLIPELSRIRLSSIDIAEIDEDLFSLLSYEKKLMPHLHLSLQSGDDVILKRMNRRHTRKQAIDFCHKLRFLRPEIAFGADIIAGFPTESEEMFLNTIKLIQEAKLQYLHIFPYSYRELTPASKMPQVDASIIKNRAKILREIGKEELIAFFKKNIGIVTQVLLEKETFGHSLNFIPTVINKSFSPGSIVDVKFIKIYKQQLIGEIVNA